MAHACSVEGCGRRVYGHGWCTKHYTRWRRHGSVADPRPSVEDRFWSHVDKSGPGGCWLWTGSRREGYGRFSVGGKGRLAHRFAYELLVGPIPEGRTIDHVWARGCRHRHCVNPAHLEPVTQRENVLRGRSIQAINAGKTHCSNGHEFNERNTRWRPTGGRACRRCALDREKRRGARRRAAA